MYYFYFLAMVYTILSGNLITFYPLFIIVDTAHGRKELVALENAYQELDKRTGINF